MTSHDLVIINPTAHEEIYQGLSSHAAAIEPPIWAALLANSMREFGFSLRLIDSEGERLGYKAIAELLQELSPKLIAVVVYGQQPSASTQNMLGAQRTVNHIKSLLPNSKVILIGGHPSALPKRTLLEEQADFVCQGEGVYTLKRLLEIDMNEEEQLRTVPGLWFKDSFSQVVSTPKAPNIPQEELATVLPGPAYDLLPMENYRAHNWHCFGEAEPRERYASIYTSLGCPFTCSFCCINAPFGAHRFRYWEPEFIVSKIDELVEQYGVRHLKIADEMFVLKEAHFLRICELLAERPYRLNIWAYARVDTVKEKNLAMMKKAGINWLGLGIESVSPKVRDDVIKGKFKEERIQTVINMIQGAGINVAGNFIFGLPEDDFASMQYNLSRAMQMGLDMANFYSAMAYPGSELYQQAVDNQMDLPQSWLGYSQHAYECLPLATNYLGADQVLAFRDHAWQAFHTDPVYIRHLKEKFGDKTALAMEKMTQYRLPRQFAATTLAEDINFPHFRSEDYAIPRTR